VGYVDFDAMIFELEYYPYQELKIEIKMKLKKNEIFLKKKKN